MSYNKALMSVSSVSSKPLFRHALRQGSILMTRPGSVGSAIAAGNVNSMPFSKVNNARVFSSSSVSSAASSSPFTFFQKKTLPANTIIRFVPQQEAWVVERMGKFHRILEPGLAILVPFLDKIAYVQSLKESALAIPSQSAITSDNVTLDLDGVLYIRVDDAYHASYGVEDATYAVSQLAQTTMRAEIGQLTLDTVLRERATLNSNICKAINDAATAWGITCLRYEIRDVHPPQNVLDAMHRQVSAERAKRAEILESEGHRQAAINRAEGTKRATVLASEAAKTKAVNEAQGHAEAIVATAQATAQGIKSVSDAIKRSPNGKDAIALQVAEKYVEAFGKLAKESNTVVIPAQLGEMGSFIASGMGIFEQVRNKGHKDSHPEVKKVESQEKSHTPEIDSILDAVNSLKN